MILHHVKTSLEKYPPHICKGKAVYIYKSGHYCRRCTALLLPLCSFILSSLTTLTSSSHNEWCFVLMPCFDPSIISPRINNKYTSLDQRFFFLQPCLELVYSFLQNHVFEFSSQINIPMTRSTSQIQLLRDRAVIILCLFSMIIAAFQTQYMVSLCS